MTVFCKVLLMQGLDQIVPQEGWYCNMRIFCSVRHLSTAGQLVWVSTLRKHFVFSLDTQITLTNNNTVLKVRETFPNSLHFKNQSQVTLRLRIKAMIRKCQRQCVNISTIRAKSQLHGHTFIYMRI